MSDKGLKVVKLYEDGESQRMATIDSAWDAIGRYIRIRFQDIMSDMEESIELYTQNLYSTRGPQALETAAQGFYNFITPHSDLWMKYEPPQELKDDDSAKQWCDEVTRITHRELKASNFYQVWMEDLLNHIGFGTSLLFCQDGEDGQGLNFKEFENGHYCLYENNYNRVDTVTRKETFTAIKAKQEFGEDNLPKEILEDLNSQDPTKQYTKHEFVYFCGPREDADRQIGKIDAMNRPIAEIWVHKKTKKVVKETGYFTFPYMPGRYLKWGKSQYGFCPSFKAIFSVRQLNFMERQMDVGLEKWFNPPMSFPDTMEETLDLAAGGENAINTSDPNAKITPIHTVGDPNTWQLRIDQKEEEINELYFVDLFTLIAGKTKEMTAQEVRELTEERVVLFTSSYLRLENEKLNAISKRVFDVLIRQGKFPEIPESMIKRTEGDDDTGGELIIPSITYSSKLSQAIKSFENNTIERSALFVSQVAAFNPAVVDNYKWDEMARMYSENTNMPLKLMNTTTEVDEIRKDRSEREALEASVEAAPALASAAKDASEAGISLG